jgi:hypothetical protein
MGKDKHVKKALFGVTEAEQRPDRATTAIRGIIDPPGYLLRNLLETHLGFKRYDVEDKSRWQFILSFKGHTIWLRDWKGRSWSFAVDPAASKHNIENICIELLGKLRGACRLYEDHILRPKCDALITIGNFAIDNMFRKLYSAYTHFRKRAEGAADDESLAVRKIRSTSTTLNEIARSARVSYAEIMSAKYAASHDAAATLMFFFAGTEILFDIAYAFSDIPQKVYFQFRKKSWSDRFKTVFPVSTDRHLHEVYRDLKTLLDAFRHEIAHGLGGSNAVLVGVPGIGMIPVSYEKNRSVVIGGAKIASPRSSDVFLVETEAIPQIMACLDRLDAWMEDDLFGWCVKRYAQSGLIIPFHNKRIEEIRSHLGSKEQFETWIMGEEERVEAWINGDIS